MFYTECYKLAFFRLWLFVNCSVYKFVGIIQIFVDVETLSKTPVSIIAFANTSMTGTETLLPTNFIHLALFSGKT